jgi:hypothetical protein
MGLHPSIEESTERRRCGNGRRVVTSFLNISNQL